MNGITDNGAAGTVGTAVFVLVVALVVAWAAAPAPDAPETANVTVVVEGIDRPYTVEVVRTSECDDAPPVRNATVADEWFDTSKGYERASIRVTATVEATVTDAGYRYGNRTLEVGNALGLALCQRTINGTLVDVQGPVNGSE